MKTQYFRDKPRLMLSLLFGSSALLSGNAMAVNSTAGIKNAMMGGASIALPLDAMAASNNPAGMAFVPSSFTTNVQIFQGNSSSEYVLPGNQLTNDTRVFIPEGGINWVVNPQMTIGLTVSGNGMKADYKQAALPVPGASDAKSSLENMEINPNASWKINPNLAVGAGLNLVRQQFDAGGVIVSTPGGPLPLPIHGSQNATGVGFRLGALWKATPEVSFGVAYKSKVDMSKLDGYANDLLVYSEGRMDLPEQYGVGVAWKPTPKVTVAADWLKNIWSGVKAMKDPNGFNWQDETILRVGVAWDVNADWTLRAGFNKNQGLIRSEFAANNLLGPKIHEEAYSAGASFKLDSKSEFSTGFELSPTTTLNGSAASTGTSLTSKVLILMLGYHRSF